MSRSSSKLDHVGQKLGHKMKSKKNLVYTLEGTVLTQSS